MTGRPIWGRRLPCATDGRTSHRDVAARREPRGKFCGYTGAVVPVQGIAVPAFLYGTTWKEGQTARLTQLALNQGFRAVDTANQRRHYFEAAVGEAVEAFTRAGNTRRSDLFLQTKFTYQDSQDRRIPYDPPNRYQQRRAHARRSRLFRLRVGSQAH